MSIQQVNQIKFNKLSESQYESSTPVEGEFYITPCPTYALDDEAVHKTGDETIGGNKTFNGYTTLNTPTIKKQNTENEGGQIYFERSDGDVTMNNNSHPYIDFWSGKFRFIGQSSSQSGSSVNIPFSVDIQNNRLCHGNSMKVMNYVVETYKSGTSWYRIWSDGWIEQGFRISTTVDAQTNHTFLKPFKDTNYTLLFTTQTTTNNFNVAQPDWITNYSTTGFSYHCDSFAGQPWIYACGY